MIFLDHMTTSIVRIIDLIVYRGIKTIWKEDLVCNHSYHCHLHLDWSHFLNRNTIWQSHSDLVQLVDEYLDSYDFYFMSYSFSLAFLQIFWCLIPFWKTQDQVVANILHSNSVDNCLLHKSHSMFFRLKCYHMDWR